MNYSVYALFFIWSSISIINAQIIEKNDESFFLKSIVDGYYLESDSTIVWKPTVIESFIFPKSDDGFCHTKQDTIFQISSDSILSIFSTSEKSGGWIIDCHACLSKISVALFVKNDSIWKLENFTPNFNSYGPFGYRPYKLIEYHIDGQKYYFIELDIQTNGQGGAPISSFQKQWFDLNGEMVFSFDYEYGDEKRSESSTYEIKDEIVVVSVFDENKKSKKIKEKKYKFNTEKNAFEIKLK